MKKCELIDGWWSTKITFFIEMSCSQNSNICFDVVYFISKPPKIIFFSFIFSMILKLRRLWQLEIVIFLHRWLTCSPLCAIDYIKREKNEHFYNNLPDLTSWPDVELNFKMVSQLMLDACGEFFSKMSWKKIKIIIMLNAPRAKRDLKMLLILC